MTPVEHTLLIYMVKYKTHEKAKTLEHATRQLTDDTTYGPISEELAKLHKYCSDYMFECERELMVARWNLFDLAESIKP